MLTLTARSRIASEFQVSPDVVATFEEKLAAGDPIPFLARRYPDSLGELDAVALRKMRTRIDEAHDLELRRANLLKSIEALGESGESLKQLAQTAFDRWQLEDISAALRKPKGTRGAEAIGKGLEPLADAIVNLKNDGKSLDDLAAGFVSEEKSVATAQEALHGASAILAERYAAEYDVRQRVRREIRDRGEIVSKVFDSSKPGADRYREFFDHRERGKSMAPRRYLKLRQAEKEHILKFTVEVHVDDMLAELQKKVLGELAADANDLDRAYYEFKKTVLRDAVTRILLGALEVDIRTEWKERADLEAIGFLRKNLRNLCMHPPFGACVTLGVDPGARKGIRIAIAKPDGSFITESTLLNEGEDRSEAIAKAVNLIKEHRVRAIAISDDTENDTSIRFFREVLVSMAPAVEVNNSTAANPDSTNPSEAGSVATADVTKLAEAPSAPPEIVRVSEVGVSAIANSPLAREEFGDQPVPVRAAMSMARRLQDPLAEYARLDPKLLSGYHHGQDIAKSRLERMLNEEFDACVHEVPVDLNLAAVPVLALVGSMGIENAKKIVEWRRANGSFPSRVSLARVGLEEKFYQRCVAFLRVHDGADPLDETGVHPDHAAAVAKIVAAAGVATVRELTHEVLNNVNVASLADDTIPLSVFTLVRSLLLDGSRDPRGAFRASVYNDGVRGFHDLKPGRELDGIVRGVAQFGVFVDIGIGQDGLMHVSELADHFVKDAHDIVKLNDRVRVRVIEVDPGKRKISLTMRSDEVRKKAEEERQKRREERQAARERAREHRRRMAEMRQRHEEQRKAAEAAEKARVESGATASEGQTTDGASPAEARPKKSYELLSTQMQKAKSSQRVATARRDGIGSSDNRSGNNKKRGGSNMGPGKPRKDGRGRNNYDETDDGPDEVRKDAPKAAPTAPPGNAFKKFFQEKGILGS